MNGLAFLGPMNDQMWNKIREYRIYLVNEIPSNAALTPPITDGLKAGHHAALGFPDLAELSLWAGWIANHGVNPQEAQRGAGEKFPPICIRELTFVFYAPYAPFQLQTQAALYV